VRRRLGFVAGAVPGRLVLPAAEEGAPPVLVLSFDPQAALADDAQAAAVRACTLSLDVPQTDEKAEPFPAWHNAARTLSDDMDATLVDDQGSRSRCTPSPPSAASCRPSTARWNRATWRPAPPRRAASSADHA
jgi:hypothetical protein